MNPCCDRVGRKNIIKKDELADMMGMDGGDDYASGDDYDDMGMYGAGQCGASHNESSSTTDLTLK